MTLPPIDPAQSAYREDRASTGPSGASQAGRAFFGCAAASPAQPADATRSYQPGQRIAHFVLTRFLAEGGMGQVWEAFDEQLRRPVALKFVRPDRVDERALARFEREARAGARLVHRSIVRTLAFDGAGDPAWIAQELVEGSWTLKDFLDELRAEDKLPAGYFRKIAELIVEVADGLELAHQAGVIHRDIKPQNILIAPDDTPKLTDFGLARLADDSFLSMSGEVAGTYAYMSPEQVTAKRLGLDHRTDVFSLGIVLYELLSLRRPFEGDTTHQISEKILFFEPPEPWKIRSQCPRELSIVCCKALEKDPGRRYPTMAEFAADLRRHLANEPIHARPPGALMHFVKWAKRNPGASSAAGVGIAALAVISGLLIKQVQTANELVSSNAALSESNTALEKSNLDLTLQTQRAEAGERDAQRYAESAQKARDEATQTADDVLSLSAQKDLDDLVAEAARLWPAHPEMIPAYEEWLRRAKELIDGRPADESRGLKQRPSLAEHRVKLAELRRDARPLSEAQSLAEREPHPKNAELQAKEAELLWLKRMLGEEAWPSEASVEAALAQESPPSDSRALNALAWPLVDPARPVYGQEVRALLLARRAVTAASPEKRAMYRDTLAWALFRVGRFDDALGEERTALLESEDDERRPALESSAADLERHIALWRGDALAVQHQERDRLSMDSVALTSLVNEPRTYEFEDAEKDWWNRQLERLLSDLEGFSDRKAGLMGDTLAEPFGWGVAKRHEFAQTIGARSVDGPEAKELWSEAIFAIKASPKYGGLGIVPQLGLLPIGKDPDSQLWEFAHLQTGDPAVRGEDGKLVLSEGTGLVFVLIPGGKFWMGAQYKLGAQNHDPNFMSNEDPVHEVELSAYFLSKYEMTQAQWLRIAAVNPSVYRPPLKHVKSLLHPMEDVSWEECFESLERLGLSLPSEAQWERGARGGTATVWWTGDERESLRGKANLADQAAKMAGAQFQDISDWPDLEDGSAMHCAVGTYAANAFGLHEVAGNVMEWCLDGYDENFYAKELGVDPLSPWFGARSRVLRGGSYAFKASSLRSANRDLSEPHMKSSSIGLRPARALHLLASPLQPPK